jgi:hypothetical protein
MHNDELMPDFLRNISDYLFLVLLMLIIVVGVIGNLLIIIPIGLVLYVIYEFARMRAETRSERSFLNLKFWLELGIVIVISICLVLSFDAFGNSQQVETSTTSVYQNFTIPTTSTELTTSQSSTSASTTSVTSIMTTTIEYSTLSSTATTSAYGYGSLFLPANYRLYICGGSGTGTTKVSWIQEAYSPGYSSVGHQYSNTCVIYAGGIQNQFNSQEAAIAGIGLNASNYTLFSKINTSSFSFPVNIENSFIVGMIVGDIHSPSPYVSDFPNVQYPVGFGSGCSVERQEMTTPVRENSSSFVTSSASIVVCQQAQIGNYTFSQKLSGGTFAAYVFVPK